MQSRTQEFSTAEMTCSTQENGHIHFGLATLCSSARAEGEYPASLLRDRFQQTSSEESQEKRSKAGVRLDLRLVRSGLPRLFPGSVILF
jgi:hypothetical protein